MKIYLSAVIILLAFVSCQTEITKSNENIEVITLDTITEISTIDIDSVVDNETQPLLDSIILTSLDENKGLALQIEYLKEEWADVPNPVIAFYGGVSIGDYFHITFMDDAGNDIDFGDGDNNFSDYKLFDENYESNSEYLGKLFQIEWEWKPSTFPCCEGEMTQVTQIVPSIVSLNLVKM